MSRLIPCNLPGFTDAWVKLPDRWIGDHANRRDVALAKATEAGLGQTLSNFSVAMALLDNWRLPGIEGNPEKWDFSQLDWGLIAWVIEVVVNPFLARYELAQRYSILSLNGLAKAVKMKAPTSSDEEE